MKPKILIVEDDPPSLLMVSTIVQCGGYQPLSACNARAAIDILKEEIPQLIIQDLSLPDLDGVHLVQCIHRLPNCSRIPVIVLSGSSARIEAARLSRENFVAFLTKPVEQEQLLSVIRQYLPDNKLSA